MRTFDNVSKVALVAVLCAHVILAQDQGRQASAGPISDFLNTVGAPKVGYAPGVHQAVANTGAQPNPANLFPGLGGLGGANGQGPFQGFGGLAQAGQSALTGFAQAGQQLFTAALQPFQNLAQALFQPGAATAPGQGLGGQGLFGDVIGRIGNLTGVKSAGQPLGSNIIPRT